MFEYKFTKTPIDVTQLAGEIEADISKKVMKSIESDVVVGYIVYTADNSSDNLCLTFDDELSSGDETTLGTTVSSHTPA